MEQNENFYKDVRKILDTRNIKEMVENYEKIKENSVKEKKTLVRRNHIIEILKKKNIKETIEIAIKMLSIVAIFVAIGGITIGIALEPQRKQVDGIKTVMQELNPEATEKQLNTASEDTYYVLNSDDPTAMWQIYYAYTKGFNNADLVLETAYEISNNQDEYEFLPEGGYTVEINSKSFSEYLYKSFPEYDGNFDAAYQAYKNHIRLGQEANAEKRLEEKKANMR